MAIDPSAYPALVRPMSAEEGGGFLAEAPDLPGCMSDGETPGEAIENLHDAITSWIRAAQEANRPIPPPSRRLVVVAA